MKNSKGPATCLVATCLLVASGQGTAGENARAMTPSAKGPAIHAAGFRMTPGKPRPPVEVSLEPGEPLQSGVPAELRFRLRFPAGLQLTRVSVEGSEALSVHGEPALADAFETGGTEVLRVAEFGLSATPLSGGTVRLRGIVHYTIDDVAQAAPFNVALQVGGMATLPKRAAKQEGFPETDATGEAIYSMNAETTVR